MALFVASSSILPSLAFQAARASPRIIQVVSHCSLPSVQKRNLGIVDIVVQGTIDATVLTTGFAGLRRMTGFDMRTQADKIRNPDFRRYCYNYLDFGERCADKITHWCGSKKPNCSYHTYYDKYGHPQQERIEDKKK